MKFPTPLKRGRLVQRYKRFLADVILDDGTAITASCPNTGSMLGLTAPGSTVWLSETVSATRKYAHTWHLVEDDLGQGPSLVGIDTGLPNKIVAEAIAAGDVPELAGYATLRREVKYGVASRIDILLEDPVRGRCYVEIKNVHLSRTPGLAEFPDCKTERGVKHLGELSEMVRQGHRAVMVYLVQRNDAERFAFAADLDPAYAKAFVAAKKAGVEALAYSCSLSPSEIVIGRSLPIAS
jgi:sugar fermentation stimulation protein A